MPRGSVGASGRPRAEREDGAGVNQPAGGHAPSQAFLQAFAGALGELRIAAQQAADGLHRGRLDARLLALVLAARGRLRAQPVPADALEQGREPDPLLARPLLELRLQVGRKAPAVDFGLSDGHALHCSA